jgi:hypothetical protein
MEFWNKAPVQIGIAAVPVGRLPQEDAIEVQEWREVLQFHQHLVLHSDA